jgi:hypothetical protein
MNDILRKIQSRQGIQLPREIVDLYNTIDSYDDLRFIFDIRGTGSHWLLTSEYFLIHPRDLNERSRGRFFIKDHYVTEKSNTLTVVNEVVSASTKSHWSEDKVFAFAWSNDVVEKDGSLVYIFNKDGSPKGIFVHSLNYVDEKVFVAANLSDLFRIDADSIISSIQQKSRDGLVRIRQRINAEAHSYKSVLKESCAIIDVESVDDIKDYKHILDTFNRLSEGKFSAQILSFEEDGDVGRIELQVGGQNMTIKVDRSSASVDLGVVDFINEALISRGFTRKRFVVFKDIAFGQEVGLAFVSKTMLSALMEIKTVEILKE